MKKILPGLICLLAGIVDMHAQTLIGTTNNGGNDGGGAIIQFTPATNKLTVIKSFESFAYAPVYTRLVQAGNGKLYGVTFQGGRFDNGVIFSYDPANGFYTRIKDFDFVNGAAPLASLVQASDGMLYGMTLRGGSSNLGVIFSFDPSTSTYTKLVDFDGTNGASPSGSLIQASNGKLYGVTDIGGTGSVGVIFSFDPATSAYTKLKDFESNDTTTNGFTPVGGLVQADDGKLYGMTSNGGSTQSGVIFSFDPSTSTYTQLADFDKTNGAKPTNSILIQANNGQLYGMTTSGGSSDNGVIFSFDPGTSTVTKLKDLDKINGTNPYGSLIQASDGKLYALTVTGGSNNAGVIFSFDISTLIYSKLKDLDDTNSSQGSLMQASDGTLYGLNRNGIFSFDPYNSDYNILKQFRANENGSNVTGNLIQANNGNLYGVTVNGGSSEMGVLFSLDANSGTYSKLMDFDKNIGNNTQGGLMQARDGKIYGLNADGGSNGAGIIFSFDLPTNTFAKLWDFDVINGGSPQGSLIQSNNGKLYGLTVNGGSNGVGAIFSFDPATGTYTKLKDFDNSIGSTPRGSLLQANNGRLYGITYRGGSNNAGVIFSFDPATSTFTQLWDFTLTTGTSPLSNLTQASDGKLYGMTLDGGNYGYGVIFSYDPLTSIYLKLNDFDYANGAFPRGSLVQASDGKLYGRTDNGGSHGAYGVIFSFDPISFTYTKLKDVDSTIGSPSSGSAFIEVRECIAKTTFYKDTDGDGYGSPTDSIRICSQPAGYVTDHTDCDDTKASVHPGATEICGNGIDDNCNGQADENYNAKPTISINDITVDESKGVAILTVTLSKASSKPVWILYYTKEGTAVNLGRHKDYVAKIALLTMRPGSSTGTIAIKIIRDNIPEPAEYFDVILVKSYNATIEDGSGRVFIVDNQTGCYSKNELLKNRIAPPVNNLAIKAMPNPTASQFNLVVESTDKITPVTLKVFDVQGKLIETKTNLLPGQNNWLGNNYLPGNYLIHAIQGIQRKTISVIKQSR